MRTFITLLFFLYDTPQFKWQYCHLNQGVSYGKIWVANETIHSSHFWLFTEDHCLRVFVYVVDTHVWPHPVIS